MRINVDNFIYDKGVKKTSKIENNLRFPKEKASFRMAFLRMTNFRLA